MTQSLAINKLAENESSYPCFEGSLGEGEFKIKAFSIFSEKGNTLIVFETNGDAILPQDAAHEDMIKYFEANGFTF